MDRYYILLVLPAMIFALWAQFRVKSTFNKYSSVFCSSGMTGRGAAEYILSGQGVTDVSIQKTAGDLTDNFNPVTSVVSLSEPVYDKASVAAVGVAAHECGHVLQYHSGYLPIKLRSAIIPVTNIGSALSLPLILIGLVLSWYKLAMIGVIAFSLTAVFQLITLPVEFDASRRAINILSESGRLTEEELKGAKKVLTAAALTYVAALAVSIAQLLRLLAIVSGGNRRR